MNSFKDTYGYAVEFFSTEKISTIELAIDESKVLIVPEYQGRVMTSTSSGITGKSYGWINYDFISSKEQNKQFNVYGGEERFWLGPEGGPFSWYFEQNKEQIYDNWVVPSIIDTEPFDLVANKATSAAFTKKASLTNASGHNFDMQIDRTIQLLSSSEIEDRLKLKLPKGVKQVAYSTLNKLTNIGKDDWNEQTGMPSIWLLCMFNPTEGTTIFIPYNKEALPDTPIVNDNYFGKIPSDRLVDNKRGTLFFKIDGKQRGKIGIPNTRALPLLGSYDSSQQVLTLLECTIPQEEAIYMNGIWGNKEPFIGDVINCYNDGPLEDGSIMGPFYEIESSSPGAALSPGQSLTHNQCIYHIEGDEKELGYIIETLFSITLKEITTAF